MFKNKKVLLAYLSVCVIWGSTYLAIRIGVKDFPPFIFAGTRFVIAGFIMMLYAKAKGVKFPSSKNDIIDASITGLFLLTGANGFVVMAEQWVESGMVSLIVAICPLIIVIIEVGILKRFKIMRIQILGIVIGFIGVAYLVLSKSSIGEVHLFGTILTFLAPLFWAIGSVYSKVKNPKGDILGIISYQMLAGGFGQLIIGLLLGEVGRMSMISASSLWAWAYLIVFGSLIGYSSYIYILQELPASIAITYAYINPLVAVFLGSIILHEVITLNVLISASIIIIGVVLVTQIKAKPKVVNS